ncbi:aminomethyltransferase [Enterobacterales bacterium CwR94]|nr:aminomethyltransferase [Enterobacterales bacterium CwR94]
MDTHFMGGERQRIPARHGKAIFLRAGEAVQVINTHGTQVVDCWAYDATNMGDYMCMEATRVWNQRLNPVVGDSFITALRHPILTLVADTSPGVHDTFMAACDARRYELLGCKTPHRNCHDNLHEGMQALGITLPHGNLASFNIFMNIQVQPDGRSLKTLPTVTRPGDYIVLRAEMDCYVAFSACPQDIVSIQGQGDNTPRDAELRVLTDGFPQPPLQGPWVP